MKWLLALFLFIIFVSCASKPCPADAKICPDGSSVGRVGANCEFALCPEVCDYDPSKIYILKVVNECSAIQFSCENRGVPFTDDCGCGCVNTQPPLFECTFEILNSKCTEKQEPVCGWFNENVQCVTYPCAKTYSNNCWACQDNFIEGYSIGECPGK